MSPLLWLGGSEDGLALRQLAGQWADIDGSHYHLYVSRGKIDVLTIRPRGHRIFTEGLITEKAGNIYWGRRPKQFQMTAMSKGGIVWTRGSRQFIWQKLQ